MARPPSCLIDLAAGRNASIGILDEDLVRSAIEHRMQGLLYTWASEHELLEGVAGKRLTAADAQSWARNQLLAVRARQLEDSADDHGVKVAFVKGIALESQIYGRLGERPTSDIDVVIRSGAIDDIANWVASLQPKHLWVPDLSTLIGRQYIQSVDLVVDGVQVDIHFDPLKLEIVASRHPQGILSRTAECDLGSVAITGLAPDANLFLALLHLNKDRFRSLIGFADVRRLLDLVEDWHWLQEYATAEGLRTPILSSLDVVRDFLQLDLTVPSDTSMKRRLWTIAWPEQTHLLGREGLVRFRNRQMLIPLFGRGRRWDALRGMLRRMFPPRAMVRAFYPERGGSYLRALFSGRIARRRQRARQRREVAMLASPPDDA